MLSTRQRHGVHTHWGKRFMQAILEYIASLGTISYPRDLLILLDMGR
jgi:hypothetical protein